MALEQKLRVQGLRYNHETERLGMAWVFQTSKSALSDTPPLARPYLPNSSANRDQTFKHMHLWEPFSFKPPHGVNISS